MEENLKDRLMNKKVVGWGNVNTREKEDIFSFCNGYINFLNKAKTEREAVCVAKEIAESNGFKDISTFNSLKSGDKVYFINRDKSMYLLIVREKDNKGAPAEILDVRIVSEKDYDRYAQRAAELNKSNKQRHYSIEKHDDNSLVAFLATDRQYDMNKYADLANLIRSDISELADSLELLGIYYREAAQATAANKPSANTTGEQPHE